MKNVKLLTPQNAAYTLNGNNYYEGGYYNITPGRVRGWIRRNLLPAIRIGHRYYIKEKDLDALIEGNFVVTRRHEKATLE